jgi:hypothetical protein
MPIKINASARLRAGWFDALSDAAKKAYKKLHPNSKVGESGNSSSAPSKGPDALKQAKDEHDKNRKAYDAHRDSMHDGSTDAEWSAHDKALQRMEKSRDRLAKLKR